MIKHFTYRDLLNQLKSLTEEQLDLTLTVESITENECFPAAFAICDVNHDSLNENHPVIYFE